LHDTGGESLSPLQGGGQGPVAIEAQDGDGGEGIASANGIDDPLRVQAGVRVNLNAKASVR
jgi:hypothetical protein